MLRLVYQTLWLIQGFEVAVDRADNQAIMEKRMAGFKGETTMTISVTLPAGIEARLRECIAAHEIEQFRRILVDAIAPQVQEQLQPQPPPPTEEEFATLMNELDEILGDTPLPPNYDDSRAGIYQDHP